PNQADGLLHINVKQIRDSALFKKHGEEKARAALKGHDEVSSILESLGFDPFKDLSSITIAASATEAEPNPYIIAHGQFDLAKFAAKAEEESKNHPDALKIHKEG